MKEGNEVVAKELENELWVLRAQNEALNLRNRDLQAELTRARADLEAKEALIARKDLFIEQTLTQVIARMGSLNETQLNESFIGSSQSVQDSAREAEIQKWLTKVGKYMSPQRVHCIAVLGDFLMRNPRKNGADRTWDDYELAHYALEELVRDCGRSTSQTLDMIKSQPKKDFTPSKAFEAAIREMHDPRLDDTVKKLSREQEESVLHSLHKLFDVNAFNIPTLAKNYPGRKEAPAYSSIISMFKN